MAETRVGCLDVIEATATSLNSYAMIREETPIKCTEKYGHRANRGEGKMKALHSHRQETIIN